MQNVGLKLSLPPLRDPDAESLVTRISALAQPALRERGVGGARAYLEERARATPAGPELHSVDDHVVTVGDRSFGVRLYRGTSQAVTPVVVYFHGGGWVIGSIEASDAFCRRLAQAAECIVVSVGYPLAPEDPFPAAVDCAVSAIEWAAERSAGWGGDATRLLVLGDSAGGNIATVAVRRLVDAHKPLVRRQILAYPGTAAERGPSGNTFAAQWPLTDDDRVWFLDHYVTDEAARASPDVAPLLADVTRMPATTLLLGGCDPLAAEGLRYAEHLWASGVSVDLHFYAGQIHGFLTMDETILPRSREALGLVANAIRNA